MAENWLHKHLEEFVKPVLGEVPRLTKHDKHFFTPHEMSVVKNTWRSVKRQAQGRPILLPGRDVFIFEILARREGYPTTFRPDISRITVDHIKEDYSNQFLLDTGFMGSIPNRLRSKRYTMVSANRTHQTIYTHAPINEETHQVFPRMTGSRSLALKIEYTPKYWKRAFVHGLMDEERTPRGHEIRQELSDRDEFRRAALLTIEIYTDSSPKFTQGTLSVVRHELLGQD